MPSTFFGLTIGTSGLNAAHVAVNTTAHNISNIETNGYTRQQSCQTASTPIHVYASYGMVGSGVSVNSIVQIRDSYYDYKYWNNNDTLGNYTTKNYYMDQIQDIYYNETDDIGFTTYYGSFCNALDGLASKPSDPATRNSAVQTGQAFADYYNNISQNLQIWQDECNQQLSMMVNRVNTYASNIAALNKQICILEANGGFANDLRDQRNVLVDKLSSIVGIKVEEKESPTGSSIYRITINGEELVDGYNYRTLKVESKSSQEKRYKTDADGLYKVSWSDGSAFNVYADGVGGALEGYIAIRDGDNLDTPQHPKNATGYDYKGIPYYMKQTDLFTQDYTRQFNMIHMQGTNLKNDSTIYTPFFTLDGMTTEEIQNMSDMSMDIYEVLAGKTVGTDDTITMTNADWAKVYKTITGETAGTVDEAKEALSKWAYDNIGYAPERDGDAALFVKDWVENNAITYAMENNTGLLQSTVNQEKKDGKLDTYLIDYTFAKDGAGNFLDEDGNVILKKEGDLYYTVDTSTGSGFSNTPSYIRNGDGKLCEVQGNATSGYTAGAEVKYNDFKGIGAAYGSMPMVDYIAANMTADKMCVNPDIINDNELMATSTEIDNGIDKPDVIGMMNNMRNDKFMGNGTAADFMRGLVSSSSIDAYNAFSMETHCTNVSQTIINQRLSVSGVDKEEEAVNLVKFQQAYELAAKVISVMSQMYDKLINGTAV